MSSGKVQMSPAWTIPGYLEVRDGRLSINGVDGVSEQDESAARFGGIALCSRSNRELACRRNAH